MTRVVRWRASDGGLEHLVLQLEPGGAVRTEASTIGGEAGERYALRWALACDPGWRVRELRVEALGGAAVHLRADGAGRWTDGAGRPFPDLDGCLDVDLAATPFTNTLPIRRLELAIGEARDLRVVYVPVPELAARAVPQRYTRLAARRYRYEGWPPGFAADLAVDDDGLVVDYPGLFRREV